MFRSIDFDQIASEKQFDLVGVSTVSYLYDSAIELGIWLKENNIAPMVIIGGPHITCAPETLHQCFDFGVVGEGEQTFLELLDGFMAYSSLEELSLIPGILSWQYGEPQLSAPRALLPDLDLLPLPDVDVFIKESTIPSVLLTRGCPFACDFCISFAMWEQKVRHSSPEHTIHLLSDLNQKMGGLEVMVIKDDIAFISLKYLKDVIDCTNRIAPDLLEIPKVVYARADIFTDNFAKALKVFGVYKVVFGFESGSERILKLLKGPSARVEHNQKAIDIAHRHKLITAGHFIIGVPEETEDDLLLTYNFIIKNMHQGKLASPTTTVLTPFPRTRYWQVFLEKEPETSLLNFRWNRLEENGFASFYAEKKGTVDEWWKYRKTNDKVYIGGLPENRFLEIVSAYEPEIIEKQNLFLSKDFRY